MTDQSSPLPLPVDDATSNIDSAGGNNSSKRRQHKNFANAKKQALQKADKSSAGTWDEKVVELCGLLNQAPFYFTTSSCSGRCFVYTGPGIKATDDFQRSRVSHDPIETDYWEESVGDKSDLWLRFEPFLLHVACQSLASARKLLDTARPVFKNVGITTWNDVRWLVAIWGDEGLEMPVVLDNQHLHEGREVWLTETVNEKFRRNQAKLDAFTEATRQLVASMDGMDGDEDYEQQSHLPRHYDIIGDIALLHTVHGDATPEHLKELAQSILSRHPKTVNIVAHRASVLAGPSRSPKEIRILAGPSRTVTTHREYGVSCVVDVAATFFSPRMASERFRLCQQGIRNDEDIIVLFCGVGMEAFLLAVHSPASYIAAVDQNPVAMECAERGLRNLQRSKHHHAAASKIQFHTANVMDPSAHPILRRTYDRILAPRPKLSNEDDDQKLKEAIWKRVLALANPEGCIVHWYDFCPAHESPNVKWMMESGLVLKVLKVSNVGSVAHRQIRVCVDLMIAASTGDQGNNEIVPGEGIDLRS